MKQFSIPMALVDYIPVILFLTGSIILIKNLHKRISIISSILFILGSGMVFAAGALKATYKLLYAANVGDFLWMSNQLFANQAFGFFIAGIGLVTTKFIKNKALSVIPTSVLISGMVLGLGIMTGVFCNYATKLKHKKACIYFIIQFVCCLTMGYLSSRDFSQAYMNWIAQAINIIGQGFYVVGVVSLVKHNLKEIEL